MPRVLAGFDGFIDTIAKPVMKTGSPGQAPVYFKTIGEFGAYIAGQGGKSASLELEILDRRMGGNMPNFVRGIAALGAEVWAIGMLGGEQERLDPVFGELSGRAFSFAPAGTATALEFDDGKIFLAPRYALSGDPWPLVEAALGKAPSSGIDALLQSAELIACLNWSELAFMDSLWQKLLEKCRSLFSREKEKFVLFDLCDFSRKSRDELDWVMALMEGFSALRTVILSLNRNEALLLEPGTEDPREIARNIARRYAIDEILVHSHDGALLQRGDETFTAETALVPKPKISTGAGDHFNAAYAFAALGGKAPAERLGFACRCAGAYVSTGKSPRI